MNVAAHVVHKAYTTDYRHVHLLFLKAGHISLPMSGRKSLPLSLSAGMHWYPCGNSCGDYPSRACRFWVFICRFSSRVLRCRGAGKKLSQRYGFRWTEGHWTSWTYGTRRKTCHGHRFSSVPHGASTRFSHQGCRSRRIYRETCGNRHAPLSGGHPNRSTLEKQYLEHPACRRFKWTGITTFAVSR